LRQIVSDTKQSLSLVKLVLLRRAALALVLLGMPDVLLMDEPTNHLDIESIIRLEQFL
jgi:ATPase subunit of ABC transporter with duplicated ATPase domains